MVFLDVSTCEVGELKALDQCLMVQCLTLLVSFILSWPAL